MLSSGGWVGSRILGGQVEGRGGSLVCKLNENIFLIKNNLEIDYIMFCSHEFSKC